MYTKWAQLDLKCCPHESPSALTCTRERWYRRYITHSGKPTQKPLHQTTPSKTNAKKHSFHQGQKWWHHHHYLPHHHLTPRSYTPAVSTTYPHIKRPSVQRRFFRPIAVPRASASDPPAADCGSVIPWRAPWNAPPILRPCPEMPNVLMPICWTTCWTTLSCWKRWASRLRKQLIAPLRVPFEEVSTRSWIGQYFRSDSGSNVPNCSLITRGVRWHRYWWLIGPLKT